MYQNLREPLKALQIFSHQYIYTNEWLQIQVSRKLSKFFYVNEEKMNAKHWYKRDGNAINYCQCNWNVLAMHTLQQRPRIHDIWLQSTWQTQLIPNWLGTGWQSTHWALSFWGVSWWSVSKRPSLIRYQVWPWTSLKAPRKLPVKTLFRNICSLDPWSNHPKCL